MNIASQFRALVKRIYLRSDQGGAVAVTSVFRQPFRPIRWHDLRHTYAIRALQSGSAIYDVSHHLGHASVKTTEIYFARAAPPRSRSRSGAQACTKAVAETGALVVAKSLKRRRGWDSNPREGITPLTI